MNLEDITISKISQTQKNRYYMAPKITKIKTKNKKDRRKLLEVMDMFMVLIMVMVSQVCTSKSIKLYTLNNYTQ